MKKKFFIITYVLLVFLSIYLVFDNALLLENNKAANELAIEYDKSFENFISVTDCIDNLDQFELADGTIVTKTLDIKNCVDKLKSN